MNDTSSKLGISEERVTSRDGTRIGYRRQGQGPGLVLVQGAMGLAEDYDELAQALAPHFTVYALDRRGRGRSPKPYTGDHDIARDVEDVDAVMAETGAELVFGLSSGAVITLEAARSLPRVRRAAVYEPPLSPDRPDAVGVQRLEGEIAVGDLPGALVTSLLTAGTAPAVIRLLPRPVARWLAAGVLRVDARFSRRSQTLRDQLPGIRYDFAVVSGQRGRAEAFAGVDQPVLLLSGSRSPAYLRDACRTVAGVLPHAQHIELPGLTHSGPWNARRGGRPELVAARLTEFFG